MIVKVILVGILVALYFWVLRPQDIRDTCREEAKQEAVMVVTTEVESDEEKRQIMQGDYEQLVYDECLEENGLEN